MNKDNYKKSAPWKQKEFFFLVTYAFIFYVIIIRRSLAITTNNYSVYARDGSYLITSMMSQMLSGGIFEEIYLFLHLSLESLHFWPI